MSMKRVFSRAIPNHSLYLLYSKVAKTCTYISIYFPYKTKYIALRAYQKKPTTFTIRSCGFYCQSS
jgi:hypothetical protein